MKRLFDYLNEASENSLIIEKKKEDDPEQKKRRNDLVKALVNSQYSEYVGNLDKILKEMEKDDKLKNLLINGFGGRGSSTEKNNINLACTEKNIAIGNLIPTQREIDITKSLKFPLTNEKFGKPAQYFADSVILGNPPLPIVTYGNMFIIDGHHRWSQIYCINPNAVVRCINYEAPTEKEFSVIQMLKSTQGAIAATIADDNDNHGDNGKLPRAVVDKGTNIYTMSKEDMHKYIEDNIQQFVIDELPKYVKKLKSQKGEEETRKNCIEYIYNNLIELTKGDKAPYPNNEKEAGPSTTENEAPSREVMPQTDNGGTEGNAETDANHKSSKVDDPGSALNRLDKGKINKTLTGKK